MGYAIQPVSKGKESMNQDLKLHFITPRSDTRTLVSPPPSRNHCHCLGEKGVFWQWGVLRGTDTTVWRPRRHRQMNAGKSLMFTGTQSSCCLHLGGRIKEVMWLSLSKWEMAHLTYFCLRSQLAFAVRFWYAVRYHSSMVQRVVFFYVSFSSSVAGLYIQEGLGGSTQLTSLAISWEFSFFCLFTYKNMEPPNMDGRTRETFS